MELRPGSWSCSSPQAKGTSPSGENGAAWPWARRLGPRCDLSAARSRPGFLSQREAFVSCHPSDCPVSCSHQGPTWATALAARSRWQHGVFSFLTLPSSRPGNLHSSAWPPALEAETLGPARALLNAGVCAVTPTSLPGLGSQLCSRDGEACLTTCPGLRLDFVLRLLHLLPMPGPHHSHLGIPKRGS